MRAGESYDLIIVGGGIHGICLALESARRGLHSLLLERGEFGGATSANSQRIIHGGLRYLQGFNFSRMLQSVAEQRWFLTNFPHLVQPLQCLMPLYGDGLRSPFFFGMGLKLHSLLSTSVNCRALPAGRILSARETALVYPSVDRNGLLGAGFWQDALMTNSHELLIELLTWAQACGAAALDHSPVEQLIVEDGHVAGVVACGRRYYSRRVVNCAGPWCQQVARQFDNRTPIWQHNLLAFGVLLDREPVSEAALAVSARQKGARTYFLVPWQGKTLAGISHAQWRGPLDVPKPDKAQIRALLDRMNAAAPALGARIDMVLHSFAGIIPATEPDSKESRTSTVFIDHAASHGGPRGLLSVCGVKYTTARRVAEQVCQRLFGRRPYRPGTERPATLTLPRMNVPETEMALQREWALGQRQLP